MISSFVPREVPAAEGALMPNHLVLEPIDQPSLASIALTCDRGLTIGRDTSHSLRLRDRSVSRHHAAIEWREVAWFITDLGSTSGTVLGDERLEARRPAILRDGDTVRIGPFVFRVRIAGEGEAAPEPAADSRATRSSIFLRLRDDRPEVRELSWSEFQSRYAPLIVAFARDAGLGAQDAADVLQDVMLALFQVLPRFEYDPTKGRFRGYLKRVTLQALGQNVRRRARGGIAVGSMDAVSDDDDDESWYHHWVEHVYARAVEEARPHFEATTMEAFELFARRGVPAEEVARRLGMSVNGIHHAKSRVQKAVRAAVDRIRDEEG